MSLELAELAIKVDSSALGVATKALKEFEKITKLVNRSFSSLLKTFSKKNNIKDIFSDLKPYKNSLSKIASSLKEITQQLSSLTNGAKNAGNAFNGLINKGSRIKGIPSGLNFGSAFSDRDVLSYKNSVDSLSESFENFSNMQSKNKKKTTDFTKALKDQIASINSYKQIEDQLLKKEQQLITGIQSSGLTDFIYSKNLNKKTGMDIQGLNTLVDQIYEEGLQLVDDTRKATSRFYVGNIASQFQDIGVTAAMGMNPITIALQQGTQLSEILKSMEKPLIGLSAAFKSLIGPISLLTIGIVAAVSAGIQLVDWANLFRGAAYSLSSILSFISENITSLTVGISSVTVAFIAMNSALLALIGKSLLLFVGTIMKITAAVYALTISLLSSPIFWGATTVLAFSAAVGMLAQKFGLLDSVLKPLKDFFQGWSDELGGPSKEVIELKEKWERVNSSIDETIKKTELEGDLIGKSREEALLLQNTYDILNKLKQEGINIEKNFEYYLQAHQKARLLTEAQLRTEELKFLEERKKSYESLTEELKLQLFQLQKENEWFALGNAELERMKNQYDIILKAQNNMTYLQQGEIDVLKEYADEITKAQRSLDFSKSSRSLEDQMDFLKQNTEYIFLMGREASIAESKMNALREASEKGFSTEQTETIVRQAEKLGVLQYEYDKVTSAIQFADSTTSSFFKDMRNSLKEGKNAWEAFGDAVLNLVDSIADAIIDIGAQYLVRAVAGSFLTQNVTGIAGTPGTNTTVVSGSYTGPFANGGVFNRGLTKFAKGGTFTNGVFNSPTFFKFAKGSKFGLMGEAGPEAVMPLKRGSDGSLGVQVYGNNTRKGDVIINVINNSNSSTRTEEKETANGKEIDIIIDQIVGGKINDFGSATSRALATQKNRRLISR